MIAYTRGNQHWGVSQGVWSGPSGGEAGSGYDASKRQTKMAEVAASR